MHIFLSTKFLHCTMNILASPDAAISPIIKLYYYI
ncbi:hypothetical protein MPF_1642 [Methanohalophilus portucalensis FDF-1]|uniref:Uncharacterized protein n=1 Tax=Methanohalophilus portucalensis FDF-1 TaxID=523843 RepID=A0A1L9C3L8_9EURY|nr:hypothetical protein MPF_1642 [Methanohalophilus portucalensis FDF-1]